MCVKFVIRRIEVMSRTSVTRLVAIARPVRRARSRSSESPCDDCHRHFRSHACFANQKQCTSTQKSVCERKWRCEKCGGQAATSAKHECYKSFCGNCQENKDIGHLCYMRQLNDTLPPASYKVLYVFYDIETTQNTEYADESKLHVPNLVCAQQFCSRCDDAEDGDCARCGRRKHTFRQDHILNGTPSLGQ